MNDTQWLKVRVRLLSFGTLFRISYLCSFGLMLCICAVAAIAPIFARSGIVLWSGQTPVSFLLMLVVGVVIWPVVIATVFACGGAIGFRLLGRFLQIECKILQISRDSTV